MSKLLDNVNQELPERSYDFTHEYQQDILGMLIQDRTFLIQSIELIKPKYFVSDTHRAICGILFDYFNKYSQTPTTKIINNSLKEKFGEDYWEHVAELQYIVSGFQPGVDTREHCLDKITQFAKVRSLEQAIMQALPLMNRKDTNEKEWKKITELFNNALITDRNFDIGLDYFTTLNERFNRMEEQDQKKEVFITGFDGLDQGLTMGGLGRGEIGSFMAMPGAGKSWMLVKVAVRNIVRGKKVLFISLEMDQDKIAKRFDTIFALCGMTDLWKDKDNIIPKINSVVDDENDKSRLVVKQFPAGVADVNTIRAFLSQLALRGFVPDLICLDYVGELKDDPNLKTHESKGRMVRDLRGMAVENNCCIFTAMQPGRESRNAQKDSVIDDANLADAYSMCRPLDALWSLNQNEIEKQNFVARMFVIKHRDGKSRYTIYLKQNKDSLDWAEITQESYNQIMSQGYSKKADNGQILDKLKDGMKQWKKNGE